ncbi:MAG: hypothetical protein R6V77_06200 [Candidatus Cloacimonadaceae bacterium]
MLLILLCCLLLTSCAGLGTGLKLTPVSLQLTDTLQLPFKIEKCLLDQRSNTYYLMEQNRPNLYLYRNGQQINQLGGFGTQKTNFQKLSDIALDADGNLLALDSFARTIKKFCSEGKWIADIDISVYSQPVKFCTLAETDLIIYDAASQDLSRFSTFDRKVMFSFGRFQVDNVSHISAVGDYIAVISEDRTKTSLFTGMGQFIREISAQMVLDRFQNGFVYQDGALKAEQGEPILPLGLHDPELKLFSGLTALLLVSDYSVQTFISGYR